MKTNRLIPLFSIAVMNLVSMAALAAITSEGDAVATYWMSRRDHDKVEALQYLFEHRAELNDAHRELIFDALGQHNFEMRFWALKSVQDSSDIPTMVQLESLLEDPQAKVRDLAKEILVRFVNDKPKNWTPQRRLQEAAFRRRLAEVLFHRHQVRDAGVVEKFISKVSDEDIEFTREVFKSGFRHSSFLSALLSHAIRFKLRQGRYIYSGKIFGVLDQWRAEAGADKFDELVIDTLQQSSTKSEVYAAYRYFRSKNRLPTQMFYILLSHRKFKFRQSGEQFIFLKQFDEAVAESFKYFGLEGDLLTAFVVENPDIGLFRYPKRIRETEAFQKALEIRNQSAQGRQTDIDECGDGFLLVSVLP